MHALLTDRYELAMLGAYLREGIAERRGVFELSLRRLPPNRRFLLVAGVDRVVRYLRDLCFTDAEVDYLRAQPDLRDVMTDAMEGYLRTFRFRGDLDAIPEGALAFEAEPILRVTASLAEAQLLETFLLGVINTETRVASKAARLVLAAEGRPVFEFGARRVDPLTAPHAGRAAYIAGCAASSCEQAGLTFGVPVSGTIAHSYVLAHVDDGEEAAFLRFAESFPQGTTLLIDTYDARRGALRAARAGSAVRAVRIDSGDLLALGRDVRRILDAAGRPDIQLIASDDLDEQRIRSLLAEGAPYDAFGVGTAITLTPDAPSLGAIYKLVEIEDRRDVAVPVGKRSPGKPSSAGAKQVYRRLDERGAFVEDTVRLADESADPHPDPEAVALLVPVMRSGKLVRDLPTPAEATREARERAACSLRSLPEALRDLDEGASLPSPVVLSPALSALVPRGD
ncbi:MAG: nicotinate phosphoribosyltransferase [Deltaproteobacteria bacterium]|nr:nicotinate phosphoribosyltransferase [Myxococcales bacterium]MDP3213972.1 nicotinate phosphoribosyltransferase [Deltaproteobacteria bacterium]